MGIEMKLINSSVLVLAAQGLSRTYYETSSTSNCKNGFCDCILKADPKGAKYIGNIAETKNHPVFGVRKCKSWSETRFTPVDGRNHNYCRNPDNKKAGPWCVLEEGSKGPKIGFCDVPDCPDGMQANGAFHTSSYNMHEIVKDVQEPALKETLGGVSDTILNGVASLTDSVRNQMDRINMPD